MQSYDHDVIVVGAGLAGLAAAWQLRDVDVFVAEADERPGGRLRSMPRDRYWLNFGAHVFSGPDSASGRLITEMGVTATTVPGSLTAVAMGGRVVASGPVETYPFRLPLSLGERLALARVGLKLRGAVKRYAEVSRERPNESFADRQLRILEFEDDRSFIDYIGAIPPRVDAIFRSTLTRSSGEPEEMAAGYGIGYFHLVWNATEGLSRNLIGGSATLTDRLATGLGERVALSAPVTNVRPSDDGVTVTLVRGGTEEERHARCAIVATPAPVTVDIVAGIPPETEEALRAVHYGPYVVGAFLTSETGPMPWDSVYALATPGRSFSMLFNTANVLRASDRDRQPGGSLMVYAAANLARSLADLDDDAIARRFRDDLIDIYPPLSGFIAETVIHRWDRGLPFPGVGRSRLQSPLTAPLDPVYLAGDYLGSLYTETATRTGQAAAAAALARVSR
jgi:oxygen-dependent protoporphyrinogen oxidase